MSSKSLKLEPVIHTSLSRQDDNLSPDGIHSDINKLLVLIRGSWCGGIRVCAMEGSWAFSEKKRLSLVSKCCI